MSVLVGHKAPSFSESTVVNGGEVVDGFSLDQYVGKSHVLFFFYQKISHSFALQNCMHFSLNWMNLRKEALK